MLAKRDQVVTVGAIAVQEDDEVLGRSAGSGHDAGAIEFLGRRSHTCPRMQLKAGMKKPSSSSEAAGRQKP